ncbi:cilia- and flagella-associated protein 418-like [Lineus longissimus]|uniref:cilia- and flagella-associated protein 418-like n=1 Tax=Lineus longissimus TaxID=88925 RepID=UPI00315D1F13
MADDLDDLLDEVESKFCKQTSNKPRETSRNGRPSPQSTNNSQFSRRKPNNDLDDMIDDIMGLPESNQDIDTDSPRLSGGETRLVTSATKKCFPLYLGGSQYAQGLANSMNQRVCDKIRCTDCDFKVVSFDDFIWHSSVDYLFLRNNVPDFKRLRDKLKVKKGHKAYACQCKWTTAKELVNIADCKDLNLKWVCGKH